MLTLFCLAVVAVAVYAGFFAVGPAAHLTVLDGKVSLQHGGFGSFGSGQTGDGLHAGDVVRTAAGAHAVISSGDGPLARLDQLSEVAIRGLARDAAGRYSLDQHRGRAWYQTAQARSAGVEVAAGGVRVTSQEPASQFALLMDGTGIRGDAWQGSILLEAAGAGTRLRGDQSSQVAKGRPPGEAGTIPAADLADGFTVLNQALNIAHGGLLGVSRGALQPHQTSESLALPPADGVTTLQLALGWTAGQIQVLLQAPDGSSMGPITTTTRPTSVEIPRASAGTWHLQVTAGDASTPWAVATSWRPAAPGEEEVAKAATQLNEVRAAATTPSDLERLEDGSALKDDLARLDLVNRFPDGTNPLAVHWVTRSALIDRTQTYMFRPGRSQPVALTLEQAHLQGTNGQPVTMVTIFRKVGATWKAVFRSSAENDLQFSALAVDADGYVTPPGASEQHQRYRLAGVAAGSTLATYLNTGNLDQLTPAESLRLSRPDFTGSTQDDGGTLTSSFRPSREGGVFTVPLQDGNLLVLAPLDLSVTETPPANKCILQPRPPDAHGTFRAKIGLPRGTYGSLRLTGIFSYVAVIPSRANPQLEFKLPGGWGQVVPEKTQAPCTSGEQPGTVEAGDYTTI
jgi:hypothetical protein